MKKQTRPSQEKQILSYLQEHKTITGLDALKEFGCMRLPARISVLKSQGYKFSTETVNVKNRYGQTVRVTAYALEGGAE